MENLIGRFYSPKKIEKVNADTISFNLKYKKNYGGFGVFNLDVLKREDCVVFRFKDLELPLKSDIGGKNFEWRIEKIYTPSQRNEKGITSIVGKKLIIKIGVKIKEKDELDIIDVELLPVIIEGEEHIYVKIISDIRVAIWNIGKGEFF